MAKNYYEILKVSTKATNVEIKSAYRRLARKLHPDVDLEKNDGEAFAEIAKAYAVLGDPKSRAEYDREILRKQYSDPSRDSVFYSENVHARRWQQMAYERRYNEIIDRMIEDERRQTAMFQRAIFPIVGLLVSCFALGLIKPNIFLRSSIFGRIIIISLFIAGSIHLIGRIREILENYTYRTNDIHDSLLQNSVVETNTLSRPKAYLMLAGGSALAFGLGSLGIYLFPGLTSVLPNIFSGSLSIELLLYTPIFVLFVDLMHLIVSKFEK